MNEFGDVLETQPVRRDMSLPEHELIDVLSELFRMDPTVKIWLTGTDGMKFKVVREAGSLKLVSEDGKHKKVMTRDAGRRDWLVSPELQDLIASLKRKKVRL